VSPAALLPAALLGGVVGMDVVSFPQAMLSRPIVGATLAGALAGSALAGLAAGAALEMLAMETLPVGASRYPEWGSASVAGGTIAAALRAPSAGYLVLGVLTALAAAWVGGWSMYLVRRANGAWSVRARARLVDGDTGVVAALQWRGIAVDFVRGTLLTAAALVVAGAAAPPLAARIAGSEWILVFAAAALGAAGAASSLWRFGPALPRVRVTAALALGAGVALAVWR
jgi:mannose/fructose/N-acetylgalactosamine-specific phosphotransferase system component IIC